METFELRYFIGVAQTQNIHQASEKLHVSPASLSKAITRLENELMIKLFYRQGRNIRLTQEGQLLLKRASEMIHLEESTKLELSGIKGTIKIQMAGEEILLVKQGIPFIKGLQKKYPLAHFEFEAMDDKKALEKVTRGEAHLALVTCDVSDKDEFKSKIIGHTTFQTYVGKSHPLYSAKSVSVEELLKYPFVSPSHPLLGKVGTYQSLDGWRDDEFPRKIKYLTSSLKILEELVISGQALAYLPDYFGEDLEVKTLKILHCSYSCSQKIKLVSRKSRDIRWIDDLF